jgi:hypothetical protein
MFPGYASFGWVADKIGRRRSFIVYTLMASLLVPLYALARDPWMLLLLGTPVAFFGTGFFSGSGIIGSEIFPTHVRARALGFTCLEFRRTVGDRLVEQRTWPRRRIYGLCGFILSCHSGGDPAARNQGAGTEINLLIW